MNQRKMRIGMSIRGHGYHPAAWRHPDVAADCTLQVEHYVRSAQTAERGKLDMIFFADGAGIRQGDNPPGSLARTGRDMIELEPTMLLPALAMVTSRIGLVTTASTTYNEPYNLARRFATLDLISKGRAGWTWSGHGPSTKPRTSGWRRRWTMTRDTRVRPSSSMWSRASGTVGVTALCCSIRRAAVISMKQKCMSSIIRGGSSRCADP
jgi:alkanesulfonate monooxygenase SsuD/methylene tetrahydromethanopterin reductase-like flavin-dependent oxidoreductase (luciferase family)